MTTTIVVPVTSPRRNTYNGFVSDNPPEFVELIGGGDPSTIWGDNNDATGIRFRMDQFGTSIGAGVIGDFTVPAVETVIAATLHVRARCIDGDDRPQVPVQSLYFHISNNAYGRLGNEVAEWRIEGSMILGATGNMATLDLDLFDRDASQIYTVVADSLPVDFSPEAIAQFFAGADTRSGEHTIDFGVGGYGSITTEIYECWFDITLDAPDEGDEDEEVPNITGLAGPPRTRFFPA